MIIESDWTAASYPIIILALILAYIFDVPVPLNTVAIASGAMVAAGNSDYTMIILITVGSIVGDSAGYYIGRHFNSKNISNKILKSLFSKLKSKKIHKIYDKYGIWTIFLTRWLFTPLGVPVNLISGITRYPFRKFIIIDFFGEVLWTAIYFAIGYALGSNWEYFLAYLNGWPAIVMMVIAILLIVWFYKNIWAKLK